METRGGTIRKRRRFRAAWDVWSRELSPRQKRRWHHRSCDNFRRLASSRRDTNTLNFSLELVPVPRIRYQSIDYRKRNDDFSYSPWKKKISIRSIWRGFSRIWKRIGGGWLRSLEIWTRIFRFVEENIFKNSILITALKKEKNHIKIFHSHPRTWAFDSKISTSEIEKRLSRRLS